MKFDAVALQDILSRRMELSTDDASVMVNLARELADNDGFDMRVFATNDVLRQVSDVEFVMTDDCNLQCKYCCVDATPVTKTTEYMEMELYKETIATVFRSSVSSNMMVVFRGGEPLLAPLEWYEEAVAFAKTTAERYRKRLRVSYVTNGTLINDHWIDFFIREDIGICISIDGPPEVNDRVRGKGARIERNMKRMGERGKSFGGITVITYANYDKMPDTMRFLMGMGVRSHKFNAAYPIGRPAEGHAWLTPEQHLKAKTDIFWTMLETECAIVDAALMDQVQWFWEPGAPQKRSCYAFECGAGMQLLLVNTRGELLPCDRAYKDIPILGNIRTGIDPDHYRRQLQAFHYKDESWTECLTCPAAKSCSHGCTAYYYASRKGGMDDFDCIFNKMLYQFLVDNRESVGRLYETFISKTKGAVA